jgi:hypothetical protein
LKRLPIADTEQRRLSKKPVPVFFVLIRGCTIGDLAYNYFLFTKKVSIENNIPSRKKVLKRGCYWVQKTNKKKVFLKLF